MDSENDEILATYRIADKPLYVVGCFDVGVTVYSQQVRALNLVYALVEANAIDAGIRGSYAGLPSKRIAIVGAGFAGLTTAAALIMKYANVSITLFEQRDALLPLQHGSDTRWLHPRIYDWPVEGCDTNAAMLPVLNWVAARASDVVVQVLAAWKDVVSYVHEDKLALYCNCRHLQIAEVGPDSLEIEWVGERRNCVNGNIDKRHPDSAVGEKSQFDFVLMTTGFGLERDETLSYWRNDILGQPSLDRPRQLYIVSGQGDGAAIDLFRIRISQYRQDRILSEVFADVDFLLTEFRRLYKEYSSRYSSGLFEQLESLEQLANIDFHKAKDALSRRLRRDTDAILHMKVRRFASLFDPANTRLSFQNKILLFILFRCGGFTPSSLPMDSLKKQHSTDAVKIVIRHGTLRNNLLQEVLDEKLYEAIERQRGNAFPDPLSQKDSAAWPGGYFGIPGPLREMTEIGDGLRERWRREYLPGSVTITCTAFVACIAGYLKSIHPPVDRLRITFHRAVVFGKEELLQQCTEYLGINIDEGGGGSLGRAFPTTSATIGLAYRTQRIIRSRRNVSPEKLRAAMEKLQLNASSRTMNKNVTFIIAIPFLEPAELYVSPAPVIGTLYIDSTSDGFFLEGNELNAVIGIASSFIGSLASMPARALDRIRNVPLAPTTTDLFTPETIAPDVEDALEAIMSLAPPRTATAFQINFDYSDFIAVDASPLPKGRASR